MNMNYREYSALKSALDEIMEARTVSICENPSWGADLKTFGVNWSACGTQSIEETKKFAEEISKACKIAEKLNAMQIIVNYEDVELDREAYMALISKYIEELQD